PTGSMAETLLGNQIPVTCPQCGYHFPVNCSSEPDHARGREDPVVGCICPNCRYSIDFRREGLQPGCKSGDRVSVAKFLYDLHVETLQPQHVVVFKYPEEPSKNYEAVNYIKRLVGRPEETIAIHRGDVYAYPPPDHGDAQPLLYRDHPLPPKPEDAWKPPYMYRNDAEAIQFFKQGQFQIIRKDPAQVLAMQRIVYDNEHQAQDLVRLGFPQRWASEKDVPRAAPFNGEPAYKRQRKAAEQEGAWLTD